MRGDPARTSRAPGQPSGWDLLHLVTPWLLLTVATAIYFLWVFPESGQPMWPEGATVLGLVAVSVIWVLCGHTLPWRRRALRPAATLIYFVGLLALCVVLIRANEVFVVFAIAGFFHAFLLTPWQLGVVGVMATSVVINSPTILVDGGPTPEAVVMYLLIVAVQTAAIGVGIMLAARSEIEDGKREQLINRLEAALHENAGLHAQLVSQARESGAQDERARLASEIHDTLAQGLAGIITQLQAVRQADEHVTRALDLARSSLAEARRSVRALAPGELGRANLPEALRTLTTRWAQDQGTRAQIEVTGDGIPLSPAIEVSLFRVAQESLTNVAKHAQASRVGVTLSYAGNEVLLDVRDDGRGFSGEDGTGFGLTSMRQRIRGVGGQVEVQSAPGEGTSVSARVPAIAPGAGGEDSGQETQMSEETSR